MAIHGAHPTDASQRSDLLDALRGFALAGVLLANLTAFSLYAFLPGEAMAALATAPLDRLLDPAFSVLVNTKFLSLFSLMFGVGFALQMGRAAGDPAGHRRYVRRLLALLLIGLLHAYLLWWGDVLRYYAVVGLVLLPLSRWTPRSLVALGAVVLLAMQPLMGLLFAGAGPALAPQPEAYADALAAFSQGEWPTMLRGNGRFLHWWFAENRGLPWTIAGCMLIGAALGRSGALTDPSAHARLWRWLLLGLPVGIALALCLVLSDYSRVPWPGDWHTSDTGRTVLRMLGRAAGLVLGLGYMAAFVWLHDRSRWRGALQVLAPMGRMALSNYLAQSVIGIGLFYGVGIGLGPRWGLVGVTVTWLLVIGLQVAASHWWLARFRFGPAEWLWRSVTYGRRQPMRR